MNLYLQELVMKKRSQTSFSMCLLAAKLLSSGGGYLRGISLQDLSLSSSFLLQAVAVVTAKLGRKSYAAEGKENYQLCS